MKFTLAIATFLGLVAANTINLDLTKQASQGNEAVILTPGDDLVVSLFPRPDPPATAGTLLRHSPMAMTSS